MTSPLVLLDPIVFWPLMGGGLFAFLLFMLALWLQGRHYRRELTRMAEAHDDEMSAVLNRSGEAKLLYDAEVADLRAKLADTSERTAMWRAKASYKPLPKRLRPDQDGIPTTDAEWDALNGIAEASGEPSC